MHDIQTEAEKRYQHTDHNPICNLHANDICNLERKAFTSGVELGMQCMTWAVRNGVVPYKDDELRKGCNTYTHDDLFAIFIKSIESNK